VCGTKLDNVGRPLVNGEVRGHLLKFLWDTGGSRTTLNTTNLNAGTHWPTTGTITLSGFTGHMQQGTITSPVRIQLGTVSCDHPIVLVTLPPTAEHIMGSDFMNKNNLSFDPANRCIWRMNTISRVPPILPVGAYTYRISTMGEYWLDPFTITSDQTIRDVIERNKRVFAQHKHDCGRIPGEVLIDGPDPRP